VDFDRARRNQRTRTAGRIRCSVEGGGRAIARAMVVVFGATRTPRTMRAWLGVIGAIGQVFRGSSSPGYSVLLSPSLRRALPTVVLPSPPITALS